MRSTTFQTTIVVKTEDYPGLLSFLSEELMGKRESQKIQGFHVFRYRTQQDEENNEEHVQLAIRGSSLDFEKYFNNRILELVSSGVIIKIEQDGWRFQYRMFGDKGAHLAHEIFELATEFAITVREKFGRLLEPQNEFPDEVMNRFISPGMWLLFSAFSNISGYSPIQEINAYLTAIQTRLQLMKHDDAEKLRQMLRMMIDML